MMLIKNHFVHFIMPRSWWFCVFFLYCFFRLMSVDHENIVFVVFSSLSLVVTNVLHVQSSLSYNCWCCLFCICNISRFIGSHLHSVVVVQVIQRKKYEKYGKPPPPGCPPLLSILTMPSTFGLDSWVDLIRRK